MRFIALILCVCGVGLQYCIWTKGGIDHFSSIEKELNQLEDQTEALEVRNNAMRAEIEDLKHGSDAIAETARNDLGYTKKGEIFYQIIR